MPLYEYQCNTSGRVFSRFVPLANYRSPARCKCGATGFRIISRPRIISDYEPYQCPVTGKVISGRRQHEENLKITGCRVLESGERERAAAIRAADDARLDSILDTHIEREYDAMPGEKRERLANELLAGTDLSIERKEC